MFTEDLAGASAAREKNPRNFRSHGKLQRFAPQGISRISFQNQFKLMSESGTAQKNIYLKRGNARIALLEVVPMGSRTVLDSLTCLFWA